MKKIIKVLQVGMSYNIGGTETYLIQQYRYIDKTRLTYDFVNINAHHKMAFTDEILSYGSNVFNICSRHKNPIKHYWQWYQLLRERHKDYKAIVLNANSLEYVYPIFLARFFGIPLRIIHSHNAGNQHKIRFWRKVLILFNKILLNFSATKYFACSKVAANWMFGNNDCKIIHNAIEVNKFIFNKKTRDELRKKLNIEDKFVIGHVGRFDYQKNHEFLISVFKEIEQMKKEACLLLIGVGENKENIENKVKELNLSGKILFLGMRKDVPNLLQAMDCFVLPSRFEGLPLVGIEAQVAGLPCFFADTITNELKITELAHYVSLKDQPEEWAKKILTACNYKRLDMSESVRKAGYDIKTEIKKIEKIYLEGCQ